MDESTRFLIKRMDSLENKLLREIKEIQKEFNKLQSIKNKIMGFAVGVSFVVSSVVQIIFHK